MARPIRVEYEGAVYHVYARGNEQRIIFFDDADRQLFLTTLREMTQQHGAMVHAYCLMPNHYHLILQTPRGNLSQSMGWFQVTYTVRYNRRHERSGHLFQGRYKAHVVDADGYAQELVRYIHLNPVRGRRKEEAIPASRRNELNSYDWSSHRAYAGDVERPEWLSLNWLGYWGNTNAAARRKYRNYIDEAFGRALTCPWKQVHGGLVLGDAIFLEKIKATLRGKKGAEEIRWMQHIDRDGVRKRIEELLREEPDRKMRMWIRVRLGGERLTEVGRSLGYQDGSGVLQAIKRLEINANRDTILANKLQSLRNHLGLSSVKS